MRAHTPMIHEGECTEIGFDYVVRSVRIGSFGIDFYVQKIFMCTVKKSRRRKKTMLKIKFYREGNHAIRFEEEKDAKIPKIEHFKRSHTMTLCVIKSLNFDGDCVGGG